MSVWEYKVITSGKGGFATPALLESFLNQLGHDEWEIIHFHTLPENSLAFSGLARRSTQREWNLENAVAAATRAEAEKIRAEFEAKFKGAAGGTAAPEEAPESLAAEAAGSGDGFRKPRDTESDLDPDSREEEGEADDWEKLAKEDELPTFFEAIQPLMRRNQRGAGLSAGVDQVAKRWGLDEADVIGALKECGFIIPEEENARPAYLEYDGDLFWVNVNRRGELWINTKEKPRAVFRVVQGKSVGGDAAPDGPSTPADAGSDAANPAKPDSEAESVSRSPAHADEPAGVPARHERERDRGRGAQGELPSGPDLLERLRPLMRRNRGGQGRSGSSGFLARALRCREGDLIAAFAALGLAPAGKNEKPAEVGIAGGTWWVNRDQRGGLWINEGDPSPSAAADGAATGPSSSGESGALGAPVDGDAGLAGEGAPNVAGPDSVTTPVGQGTAVGGEAHSAVFSAVRLLMKPTKTGAVAGETKRLAETLGKDRDEFLGALERAGLKVPEKMREKPVFVEHAGEIFWLNRNLRGQIWLNAKASKFADPPSGGSSAESDAGAESGSAKSSRLSRGRRATGAGEPPS